MIETRYTADHLWVRRDPGGRLTCGISGFAKNVLGDVVYIELPEVGSRLKSGTEVALIESTKVTVDLIMPVTGTVSLVNQELDEDANLINEDPTGAGWLFQLEPDDAGDFARLLDFVRYDQLTRHTRA